MISNFKKVCTAFSAIATSACMLASTAISTYADFVVDGYPNSPTFSLELEYVDQEYIENSIWGSKLQTGDIAVHCNVSNQEGIGEGGFAIKFFFGDGYDILNPKRPYFDEELELRDIGDQTGYALSHTYKADQENACVIVFSYGTTLDNKDCLYGDYSITTFIRKNSNYSESNSNIACGVMSCISDSGNMNYSVPVKNVTIGESTSNPTPYMLGDVNGDNTVDLTDATTAWTAICEHNLQESGKYSVSFVNSHLDDWFPDAVCGEAGDVNQDSFISRTDSDMILTYYAETSVNNVTEDDIGEMFFFTA